MRVAVAQQPIAVSIYSSSHLFHHYSSGVIDSSDCSDPDDPSHTTHAVGIVGYGTDKKSGLEYWLVRNSWGTDWGEDGFVKIAVTGGYGTCTINKKPV